ncbi:MAG: hypothetical protein HUU35_00550, partial [Armatimonadetes bacterium]|nr:hypothetical protein [Armatimonadota bacterium]
MNKLLLFLLGAAPLLAQGPESAPVRPAGSDFVPPPFTALAADASSVSCLGRRYELGGVVPLPSVG